MRGRSFAAAVAAVVAALVLNGGLVEAQDDAALPVTADAAADLGKALDAWDHRKVNDFANTIPFEKAVLRGAAEGKPEALVAYLHHERYGALLFAALCERRPTAVAEVKKGLAAKEAGEVAKALLTAGDARAVEFLGDAARLADDPRALATAAVSRWSDTRTTKSADGLSTTSETVPVNLKSVGEVAVEAAGRICASTLPDSVSWWYEIEKGPRFGRGAEAVKRLRQFAAADAKAVKAKAIGGCAAIDAVQAALRPGAPEMAEWKLTSVAFDRSWTIEYTLGDAKGAATVDATGHVTRR